MDITQGTTLTPAVLARHESKARFATTCWTLIRRAQGPDGGEARATLYRHYWSPVAGLFALLGVRRDALADITQDFFVMLVERNDVLTLDPARGRFRSWLRVSARNYLLRVRARDNSLKAGGKALLQSFSAFSPTGECLEQPLCETLDPEQLTAERQAADILARAENSLRNQYEAGRELAIYDALFSSLHDRGDYSDLDLALRLGKTVGAIRQHRLRMRRNFAKCVKAELRRRGVSDRGIRRHLMKLDATLARNDSEPAEPRS